MSKMRIVAAQASVFALVLLSGSAAFAQGASLSVDVSAVAARCVNGLSPVTVNYTVTSTGPADAATVAYTVADVNATIGPLALPSIAPGVAPLGGWTQGVGPNKTATGQIALSLSNGEYDIEVCAEQNGADKKSDCSTAHVQVACAEAEACDQAAILRGQVVGSKNLCANEARVNVQLSGLFGSWARITVTNPDGAPVATQDTDRAGDSCNYHWNLDPKTWDTAIAGNYTFDVMGADGHALQFHETLVCSKPGKK